MAGHFGIRLQRSADETHAGLPEAVLVDVVLHLLASLARHACGRRDQLVRVEVEGRAAFVGQWPDPRLFPGPRRRFVVRVIGDGGLAHHAVVDAAQPMVEETQLLHDDVEARIREHGAPVAMLAGSEDQLFRCAQIVEGERRSVAGEAFRPVGGGVDRDARLVDGLTVGGRAALQPPGIAEVLGHAVTERDVPRGFQVVGVLGDRGTQQRAILVLVDGHGLAVALITRGTAHDLRGTARWWCHATHRHPRVHIPFATHREDGLEMRWRGAQRLHLAATGGRTSPHADLAVAERLRRQPFGDVVGIEPRGILPLAAIEAGIAPEGCIGTAKVRDRDHIAELDQLQRLARVVGRRETAGGGAPVVRRVHPDHREFSSGEFTGPGGAENVDGQPRAVAHGDVS